MPAILATEEAEIRRIRRPANANSFMRFSLKKTHHKNGLVEWLKVYVLSSNPSLKKNKKIES
jgi:hypothetical protein